MNANAVLFQSIHRLLRQLPTTDWQQRIDLLAFPAAVVSQVGEIWICNSAWREILPDTSVVETVPVIDWPGLSSDLESTDELWFQDVVRFQGETSSAYLAVYLATVVDATRKHHFLCLCQDVSTAVPADQTKLREAETQLREMETLVTASRSLVYLDHESLLQVILEQLKRVVDYVGATIFSLDAEGASLRVLAYQGPLPKRELVGYRFTRDDSQLHWEVIDQREPVIIADTHQADWERPPVRDLLSKPLQAVFGYARSWISLPLMVQKQVIGSLSLSHREPHYYTPHRVRLISAFADYAAIAIENTRLYQQAQSLGIVQERDRLARELHDNLAQALGYLNLRLLMVDRYLQQANIDDAQATLRELKQIVTETYTDVREEIFSLRSASLTTSNFLETLEAYLEKYQAHYGLKVEMVLDDETAFEFSREVGGQIIRIIQEALINIRKHAQTNQALIQLTSQGAQIEIRIQDQGRGFDPNQVAAAEQRGFGLQIMRERAESVGAQLYIEATPGRGATIWIELPFEAAYA